MFRRRLNEITFREGDGAIPKFSVENL